MTQRSFDRGIAWVVLASSIMNCTISTGVGALSGVYISNMITYYHSSRAEGYVIGSLCVGLYYGSAPLASLLVIKMSHRTVAMIGGLLTTIGLVLSANMPSLHYQYATFSISAVGCSFLYQTSIVVLPLYFDKYLTMAVSMTMTGGGLALMVYPIFCQLIIDIYTWQPSLYIIAAMCLNTCVGSALIKPHPEQQDEDISSELPPYEKCEVNQSNKITITDISSKGEIITSNEFTTLMYDEKVENREPDNNNISENKIWQQLDEVKMISNADDIEAMITYKASAGTVLLRNKSFWLVIIGAGLFNASINSTLIILPDMYNEGEISESQQSILFMTHGVCSIVGRIILAPLLLKKFAPISMYCVLNFSWSAAIVLYIFNTSFMYLLLANITTGMLYGAFITCLSLVVLDIVGLQLMNRAFGLFNLSCGVGGILVPPILGIIYDASLNYTWSMILAAILGITAAAIIIPPAFLWKKKSRPS